jgi:hypothetical protein
MALKGSAFLALWNDFDPARDEEYNCWHTFEHVPERVGIEGVVSGRRYIAASEMKIVISRFTSSIRLWH